MNIFANKIWIQSSDKITPQFNVIYVNDCSKDRTGEKVRAYAARNKIDMQYIYLDFSKFSAKEPEEQAIRFLRENQCGKHKLTYVENSRNQGAMFNLYVTIHTCHFNDIIACVDGDDQLATNQALSTVNRYYTKKNVIITAGSYVRSGDGVHCAYKAYPQHISKNRLYRSHPFLISHLRTFRAGLFKQIRKIDLLYEGKFLDATYDVAMMFPMVEMARDRFLIIPDILYRYNSENPISDSKIRVERQRMLDRFIRSKPSYPLLDKKLWSSQA